MTMRLLYSLADWKQHLGPSLPPTVLSVGNFDGLHLGHQKILRRVVEQARARNALAAAVTFDPHPLKLLRPEAAPCLIATLPQRLAGLERMGLDAALLLRFDRELSQLSAEEFVRRILVDGLHLRAILVGANFRFGHRQSGDVRLLTSLSTPLGYQVEVVAPVSQRSEIVSSTAVRQAVSSGQTLRAARHLGRPFTLAGEIFPATGTGRRLVVPTLNLKTEQELLPANGVYATETWLPAGAEDPLSILQSSGSMDPGVRRYRSVTNIGMRPTFDATRLSVESHLFDFSGDLSSGRMVIAFWGRLREERKFRSPEELLAQIRRDISRATIFFRRLDRFRRPPPSTTEHSAGLEA